MNNLFYYEYKEPLEPKEGDTATLFTISKRSFNINKVIMTVEDGDKLVIVMDDYHLRTEEVPVRNKKGGIAAYKNKTYTHQTIISLEGEDIERFKELTKA